MMFGSKLYGTSTPKSDTDIKGVMLPSVKSCYLGKIPNSIVMNTNGSGKNSEFDVDEEFYSLQYFLKLASKGEIYLGYIIKQTSLYSVKGDKLNFLEILIVMLKSSVGSIDRLSEIWSSLPINPYCYFVDVPDETRHKAYMVCGKQLQDTMRISYALEIVQRIYDGYGKRALLCQQNNGVDWKAISHAFRACYQLLEIYKTGDLKYPLESAPFLTSLKLGNLNYVTDCVSDKLQVLLDEVKYQSEISTFPDSVDYQWVDNFIIDTYKKFYY